MKSRTSAASPPTAPVAVVTGAGGGVGRAIALALGRRGVGVALVGRTEASLRSTEAEMAECHVRTLVVTADVGRAGDVERLAAEVEADLGTPRIVVNNAGIAGRRAQVEETSEPEWDEVISTNLKGVFLVTRAFLPGMRAAKTGRFVTIASISATLGTAGLAPYCASKWGAVGFTKALAEELRGSGLQAMAVLPGTVDTPMAAVGGFAPQMSPGDVAGVVAYAALDAPDAMNGSAIESFG